MMKTFRSSALAATGFMALALSAVSCAEDGRDYNRDGVYITGDFAMLRTNAKGQVESAALDDGRDVTVSNPFTTDWTAVADTAYRGFLYYEAHENEKFMEEKPTVVKARGAMQVPMLQVVDRADVKQMRTDPLDIESTWISKNGKYANISLLLKSGTQERDNRQSVMLVRDSTYTDNGGKTHMVMTLYHSQNGVPEYYTVQHYVSFAIKDIQADSVELKVNTYNKGKQTIKLKKSVK